MNSTVEDVMTRSVVTVRETAGYKDIVAVLRSRRVSGLPVLDTAGRVAGVVSEADPLLKEVGREPFTGSAKSSLASGRRGERAKAAGVTAAELISRPAVTISPGASVAEAAKLMYKWRVKRLPVVDDTGRLVGIVSRADVLSVFTRPDGEIRDEVVKNVIAGKFALNPDALDVAVASGIVTITGHVERRALALQLVGAIRLVEGVVDVRDRIIGEDDDDGAHGRTMVDIARTALREAGRPDLASLVLSDGDRPIVDWPRMGHLPRLDEVRAVHAALRRAYEARAPGEIGEGLGQFTDDAECWYRSILRPGLMFGDPQPA